MDELKYKNALNVSIYCACFASVCVVFSCVFGIIMTYFFENARDFSLVIIIGVAIVGGVWLIAGMVILLQGIVVINKNEIKYYRWGKERWRIDKDEIRECIYNKAHWYDFLTPISAMNMFSLMFKLKIGGISKKKYCSLSFKKVKLIHDRFGYPVREIDTIYEQ